MKEFFHEIPYFAWSLVLVMLALVVIAAKWELVKWWAHNTWYSFPLIGRIASLSRDTRRDTQNPNWFVAEKTLCESYKKFIPAQSEYQFNQNMEYLRLSGDNGRTPMPLFIWALTFSMVIVEALGFSYVLAGYTLPGASENLQEKGALGIAFLIAVILVVLTHAAGHELYKSGKIRQARQDWRDLDNCEGKFFTEQIALSNKQEKDAHEKQYARLTNRVGYRPSNVMNIVSIVFVFIVAVGATYVRGQILEKQLQDQVTSKAMGNAPAELNIKINQDGLNFSSSGKTISLPAADAQENQKAIDKATADEQSIDRHGGWGTFIVLAFVFVFLQIIGVYFGYNWGFAGTESAAAYRLTCGFSRFEEVLQRYLDISNVAQSKLSDLQQRLMHRNAMTGNTGVHSKLTFKQFMENQMEQEYAERLKQQQMEDRHQAMQQTRANFTATQAPAAANTSAPAALTAETALQTLNNIQDKDAKKTFILNLPDDIKSIVMAQLKHRKEEENRLAQQQYKELDDLL
jgi:hypothetical protein